MKHLTLLISAALALVLAAPAPVAAHAPSSPNNGYVMMVHGHFEPNAVESPPPPPAYEAAAATAEDGNIILLVIPYAEDAAGVARPVAVENPVLRVGSATELATGAAVELAPNGDAADHPRCAHETLIAGHEGDVSHCLVFVIPASELNPADGVLIKLWFDDADGGQVEYYNAAAHGLLHGALEGDGGPTFRDADAASGAMTPFVVEGAADPVA